MLDLRSNLRRKLLAYYFTNTSAQHHVRELARVLCVDPTNLAKELMRLEEFGLFHSKRNGLQKYFGLNKRFSLFREIEGIVLKTVGVVPALREVMKRIDGVVEAYVYGSFAAGELDAASDIDVLIVGLPTAGKLAREMRTLEQRFGREFNYTVMSAAEWKARRRRKDAFVTDICRHKRIALVAP
jgi:predicted nucleotidyltransferase